MARDSQRSKLYGWERAELKTGRLMPHEDNVPLGEDGAREFLEHVWSDYCPQLGKPPVIRVMGNRGRGSAWPHKILLSSRYGATQTRWYILHELAHVIRKRLPEASWDEAPHGPEFCATYLELLTRYTAGCGPKLQGSMQGYRLKVS